MATPGSEIVLRVKGLTFRYADTRILQDVDLDLYREDVVHLSGPSGAGKSTLLRVLARLLVPDSGTIELHGQAYDDIPPTDYRRSVAYLQQQPVMIAGTVRDNLLLSFRYGSGTPPDDARLNGLLQETALDGISLDRDASEFSVGQQQRIALLRLLLMEPEVLLLDEPTASIDADAARLLMETIVREQKRSARSVLLVTHNSNGIGMLSPREAVLRGGRLEMTS